MSDNRLNNLTSKEWLKFQKSWFAHNPPPRKKGVFQHPAKFPETLAREFIEFFTKTGMKVLDPMAGTGSTLIACLQSGREGYGIELNPQYCEIARQMIAEETNDECQSKAEIYQGDARDIAKFNIPEVDYILTSPPYWDMLNMKGAWTQKKRQSSGLDIAYSDNPNDLGNIEDYEDFISALTEIYRQVIQTLKPSGYMTVIVKNVKKKSRMYPLAWDLGREISKFMTLKDEKIWCQDDQKLAPYGYRYAWVSNTFHHYCLNFRKDCE